MCLEQKIYQLQNHSTCNENYETFFTRLLLPINHSWQWQRHSSRRQVFFFKRPRQPWIQADFLLHMWNIFQLLGAFPARSACPPRRTSFEPKSWSTGCQPQWHWARTTMRVCLHFLQGEEDHTWPHKNRLSIARINAFCVCVQCTLVHLVELFFHCSQDGHQLHFGSLPVLLPDPLSKRCLLGSGESVLVEVVHLRIFLHEAFQNLCDFVAHDQICSKNNKDHNTMRI